MPEAEMQNQRIFVRSFVKKKNFQSAGADTTTVRKKKKKLLRRKRILKRFKNFVIPDSKQNQLFRRPGFVVADKRRKKPDIKQFHDLRGLFGNHAVHK